MGRQNSNFSEHSGRNHVYLKTNAMINQQIERQNVLEERGFAIEEESGNMIPRDEI
jgi:hypothetical protein